VGRPWPRLPREVGDAPFPGTSQARLDGARSTRIRSEMSLPWKGVGTRCSIRSLPPHSGFPRTSSDLRPDRGHSTTSPADSGQGRTHRPMMWASPVSTVSWELIASKLEFSNSFIVFGFRPRSDSLRNGRCRACVSCGERDPRSRGGRSPGGTARRPSGSFSTQNPPVGGKAGKPTPPPGRGKIRATATPDRHPRRRPNPDPRAAASLRLRKGELARGTRGTLGVPGGPCPYHLLRAPCPAPLLALWRSPVVFGRTVLPPRRAAAALPWAGATAVAAPRGAAPSAVRQNRELGWPRDWLTG